MTLNRPVARSQNAAGMVKLVCTSVLRASFMWDGDSTIVVALPSAPLAPVEERADNQRRCGPDRARQVRQRAKLPKAVRRDGMPACVGLWPPFASWT